MPEYDHRRRIRDILRSCADIQEHSHGLTEAQFVANKAVYQAVLWNFTVLGEAANGLPESIVEAQLDIPWGPIIGMRHRLVHRYGNIDLLIVWDAVCSSIPTLIPQLEALLDVLATEDTDA